MRAELCTQWSLLIGLIILDLQDLLPRFPGPPRGSRRTFLAEREGGVPRGSSRTLGDPPWGSLSLPGKSSENLEVVPRIWEGEGSWRSRDNERK